MAQSLKLGSLGTFKQDISQEQLETKLGGRGKIMATVVAQIKQGQCSTSSVEKKSLSSSMGRGNFLAQVAKQVKLKELKSWNKHTTKGEEEVKVIPHDKRVSDESLNKAELDSLTSEFKELSVEKLNMPKPQKGEIGELIHAMTNYIALKIDPNKRVYEYIVSFEPEVDFVAFRFKLLNQHFRTRRGINCFDGGTKLFLPEKITEGKLKVEATHPNDNSSTLITIQYKKEMTLGECEQLYNILFNNCAKVLKLVRLGRQSYDFKQSHQIPQHKLEVWPGYVTSIKEFDGGLLLCCDIRHKVLRSETVYDVLSNIAKFDSNNFRTIATRELLGQCVLTRYNNNMYRVDDIDWNQTPLSKFKLSNGEEISFLEYYKRQYNVDIMDTNQPLLLSKQKAKTRKGVLLVCLVPEICHMTGLTDKMRNNNNLMKEISKYTIITPAQRHFFFKKFLENIRGNSHAQEMLLEWGVTLADDPVETQARLLPSENIYFKDKFKVCVPSNASWGNFLKNHGLVRSIDLKHWIIVHTQKDNFLAQKFKKGVQKVGVGLGIDVFEPQMMPLANDKIDSYIQGLKESVSSETQMVVCLCPTARTDRYSAIKKFCCRERPVPSQVVNCGTIMRENRFMSVVQNVTLQINNKLGGASWALHIPLKNCMVCGIDTYHERGHSSVGAFVASFDGDYSKWFSKACIQEPQQELLDGLISCFTSGLKKYIMINKTLPDRIVIFRDGVSDGMLSAVLNHEVTQFLDACRLIGKDYDPKFSFIIVSKRIHTKFYQLQNELGSLDNVPAGSILDHTVTRKNYYDFFLVSQHVSMGTAMPSHYIVVYDNSGLKPDHMQRLTYKFCHLYYNWAGTVRVPAPCLYAHKLAYLVGQNLKGPASEILEDKLYYL